MFLHVLYTTTSFWIEYFFSAENALTLAEWLSAIMSPAPSPISIRFSMFFFLSGFPSHTLTIHRTAGQERGPSFLFHSTISTRLRTFKHLFATLHVRWPSRVFNCNACVYSSCLHRLLLDEIYHLIELIFSASYCPLNVTSGLVWLGCGVAWTKKGVDCFNRTTLNATIPLYKFPSLSTPDWYWSSISEVHYGPAHLLTIS